MDARHVHGVLRAPLAMLHRDIIECEEQAADLGAAPMPVPPELDYLALVWRERMTRAIVDQPQAQGIETPSSGVPLRFGPLPMA